MGPTEGAAVEGTLTILFTDLEGSTDLRNRVGDTVADELIHAHERLIRDQLGDLGALDHKALGDGFMILFSSARQGIRAAVTLQRSIEDYNRSHTDLPIKVRMGLNTGDVTQHEGDAYGTAVHAAARIAAKAQAGQILIPQIVRDLAGTQPEFRVADRGLFWLKGFPDRWRLFEVLWRQNWEGSERAMTRAAVAAAPVVEFDLPRAQGPVVGRIAELKAIAEETAAAADGGMRAIVIEGEAGIGKTRLMEAAAERAAAYERPFWALQVAADEELRGPFLLFRTLIGDPRVSEMAREAMALEQLERAREAIGGRSSGEQGFSPQEQMLRIFDEVTSAIAALAREHPVAMLFDDLQWADDDSIRLIRYVVRTLASTPILAVITMRPHSDSAAGGATNLIADLDRMHLARRLRLARFTRNETAQLLENLLGAKVAPQTLDSLHSRAEGVPFFIEEFARAYREAKVLQLVDGTWTMTRLSGPTVPSSVQSLIARRLTQLPGDARQVLEDAALVGRRFRLKDLAEVRGILDEGPAAAQWQIEDGLEPAVNLGIISELPHGSAHDYTFTHDQIREALADSISRGRRRAIHRAIVQILSSAEETESLSTLAYHALRAGDDALAVSCAVRAARAGLEAHAPDESIRIIDAALAAASTPADRVEMLRVKDDALAVLERGQERLANLAEMGALAGALADPAVDMEIRLRRAAAARASGDFDEAEEISRRVQEMAAAAGADRAELEACLELGQALIHSPLGEAYFPLVETDPAAASEPFRRAVELARALGDRSSEAAALRELALLEAGRAKHGLMSEAMQGATLHELMPQVPERLMRAKELADEAFRIYEDLGDRRGAMSALISIAYMHVADPTPRGMAGRLEHVRRLHHNRESMTTAGQRARDDALMLFSIHTFARANLHPDLALQRGEQAFEAARSIGDRWLESLAAGGVAMTLLEIGSADEAEAWVDRAAGAALAAPSPAVARRLEMWRGMLCAARAQADGIVSHFEKAGDLAGANGSPAGRCEALARLAFEAARVGAQRDVPELLTAAEGAANQTRDALSSLPGPLPWEAMAHAADSLVAQARGRDADAAEHARSALAILQPSLNRSHYFDVLWAVGRVLITQGAPEAEDLAREIAEDMAAIDGTIVDDEIKARWFAVPMHAEMLALSGYEPAAGDAAAPSHDLGESEVEILRYLTGGSTDGEIAARIGADDDETRDRVARLLDKLGVGSREAAVEYAIKSGVV